MIKRIYFRKIIISHDGYADENIFYTMFQTRNNNDNNDDNNKKKNVYYKEPKV